MHRLTENKIILVVRATRLSDLKAKFATKMQAKFYVSRLGGDFSDYESEDASYQAAIARAQQVLAGLGRVQIVQRALLPNCVFGPQDLVVALGQDGLVANTLKYLDGQPLIGVNPDPARWDGLLLPFVVRDLDKIVREVWLKRRPLRKVTMAQAALNTGPRLFAVNDFFVGARTHVSARYRIQLGQQAENHSSSGVLVSTGLGSPGWMKSLLTGAFGGARSAAQVLGAAAGVAPAAEGGVGSPGTVVHRARHWRETQPNPPGGSPDSTAGRPAAAARFPWDAEYLFFTVREPFPSKTTAASLVFGRVTAGQPLVIESQMGENGVIFSDGIEQDFLEFNSGTKAVITVAARQGVLVE